MSQIWILHDTNPKIYPMRRIHFDQAQEFNSRGYGIFQTVNDFRGARKIINLTRINAWALDIDQGTKAEMRGRIESGLVPTMVVETKRGYHVYFKAKNARFEHWKAIMEHRLIPFYKADQNAKDITRILRMPGFFHMKNPDEPFLVRKIWDWKVSYTEIQVAQFYSVSKEKQKQEIHDIARRSTKKSDVFWEWIWNLDCENALMRLSGKHFVNGEVYSFKQNGSGTKNIFVDGKSTSCWIDREGRIGSFDKGGPTIAQWLNWFHKDYCKVVQIIREAFPECQQM